MEYEVKRVIYDGVETWKFKCSKCGVWGDIGEDQFSGRVSILHEECGFHETINLEAEQKKRLRKGGQS